VEIQEVLDHWEAVGNTGFVVVQCRDAIIKDDYEPVLHDEAVEMVVVMAERAKAAEAERDALRAALESARQVVGLVQVYIKQGDYDLAHYRASDAYSLIDTALRGEGGEDKGIDRAAQLAEWESTYVYPDGEGGEDGS